MFFVFSAQKFGNRIDKCSGCQRGFSADVPKILSMRVSIKKNKCKVLIDCQTLHSIPQDYSQTSTSIAMLSNLLEFVLAPILRTSVVLNHVLAALVCLLIGHLMSVIWCPMICLHYIGLVRFLVLLLSLQGIKECVLP